MNKLLSLAAVGTLAVAAYATAASASQSVCSPSITLPTPVAGTACPVNGFNSTSIARNSAAAPNTWDYRVRLDQVKAGTSSQLVAGDLVNSAGAFIKDTSGSTCCEAVDNTLSGGSFGSACHCVTSGISPNLASKFRVFYVFSP